MASFYDLLLNSFAPQQPSVLDNLPPWITPTVPQQGSVHYKNGLGLPGGMSTIFKNGGDYPPVDVVPPVSLDERNLMGLLNQPHDQTTVPEFPAPQTPSDRSYEFKPDQGGYGFKPGEGGYGFKDPNAPAADPSKVWDTMGADVGNGMGMKMGLGLLADSMTPKAPQYAPAAPGHRPDAVSIAQLMQAYGIRR